MSEHKCHLPFKETSGLSQLPPNASRFMRLRRKLRKLTLLDPENFRCKAYYHHHSAIMAEQRRHVKSPYRHMIHPFSKFNSIVEIVFFVVWFIKMIIEPLMNNVLKEYSALLNLDFYVLCSIQLALIVCFFFVGYIDKDDNEVVLTPSRVARWYLTSYFFFDFFALGSLKPFFEYILLRIPERGLRWRLRYVLGFSDVPCLYFRMYSLLDFVDHTGEVLGVPLRERKCTRYLLKTFLYLHFFCCILYFVPQLVYFDEWPADSWLVAAKIHPPAQPHAYRIYGECMLFTIFFFFGASAGNYIVSQTNEQVCLSIIALFGRLYTLFLLADLLRFFGIVGLSEASYEMQMLSLREYMMTNNIPTNLRARMVKIYEKKLQKRYFNEREILDSLSDNLKAELFLFSAKKLMQKSDVLKYLPPDQISTLISMMNVVTYAPGDVIFKPGQEVTDIYFISYGSVAVMTKEGLELCHLEDGEVFGMYVSPLGTRIFSAVTCETTELFIIRLHVLHDFLKEYPRAAQYMKQLSAERFSLFKQIEGAIKSRSDSCKEELKKGALLEQKRKRKLVGE